MITNELSAAAIREYEEYESAARDHQEAVQELERLLACYQIASADDKAVVWAALNKYAPMIEDI